MPQLHSDVSPNLLIQAMTPGDLAALQPYLERVDIVWGQVLAEANQPVEHCYFPEDGIVSLTANVASGGVTEVGIVGREGVTGISTFLGSDRSPIQTFVQVDGTTALRIATGHLTNVMKQSETLQNLLLRYVQTFLLQSAYSTIANAHHQIETRLARWLLMCHDRVIGDEIRLTHKFMSMMIGAQRTGVTHCLHILEGSGMIKSRRVRVEVVDRAGLEELAGNAYGTPEAEYRRLIGPFGRSGEAEARYSALS